MRTLFRGRATLLKPHCPPSHGALPACTIAWRVDTIAYVCRTCAELPCNRGQSASQPASHLKATRERATPIQKFCCSSSVVVSHRVHQPPWLSLRLLRAHLSEGEKRERERELTSVAIDARLSCLSSNPGGPDYTPGRRRRRRWPSRALRRRRRQQVSAH